MKVVDDEEEKRIKATDSCAVTPEEVLQEALDELETPESDFFNCERLVILYEKEDKTVAFSGCNMTTNSFLFLLEKVKFMVLNKWFRNC